MAIKYKTKIQELTQQLEEKEFKINQLEEALKKAKIELESLKNKDA